MSSTKIALLATEQVDLEFTEEGLREIARVAVEANRTVENIGARRLHALIEKIVEEFSFDASNPEKKGIKIVIDKAVVCERLVGVLDTSDLSRHIL
jgi:ATP-dependent HslUV protease ATP-binding subunit HslU